MILGVLHSYPVTDNSWVCPATGGSACANVPPSKQHVSLRAAQLHVLVGKRWARLCALGPPGTWWVSLACGICASQQTTDGLASDHVAPKLSGGACLCALMNSDT